jgi:hypothetical protein
MKKIIILFVMAFMYIFNITEIYAEDGLKIDSKSLQGSGNEAYMSVTDIYGIPLFTEKVIKNKKENDQKKKAELNEINNNVFLKTASTNNDTSEEVRKLAESYNLFVKPTEHAKIKYMQENSSDEVLKVSISIIMLCILTAILTRKYHKHKSQKEDYSNEYKDYDRPESI